MEPGDIPEDANERMYIVVVVVLLEFRFASICSNEYDFCVSCIVALTDCPGTQSESAGKSDACEGCPNQQICATAPKGPDPGTLYLYLMLLCFFPITIKYQLH